MDSPRQITPGVSHSCQTSPLLLRAGRLAFSGQWSSTLGVGAGSIPTASGSSAKKKSIFITAAARILLRDNFLCKILVRYVLYLINLHL